MSTPLWKKSNGWAATSRSNRPRRPRRDGVGGAGSCAMQPPDPGPTPGVSASPMSDPESPASSEPAEPKIEGDVPETEVVAPQDAEPEADAAEDDVTEDGMTEDDAPATETAPAEADVPPPVAKPPIWRRRPWQIGAGVAVSLLIVLVLVSLLWSLPLGRALEPLANSALVIVAADGSPIARRGSYKEAPIDRQAARLRAGRLYRHRGPALLQAHRRGSEADPARPSGPTPRPAGCPRAARPSPSNWPRTPSCPTSAPSAARSRKR
jgi:hypothetical protein